MVKIDQAKLYSTQISLSEWFEKLGYENIERFRKEDNDKRERLAVLSEVIGLPFDKPYQFPANFLNEQPEEFKQFLKEHGSELCALRLIPVDPKLPKLRIRGLTINDSLDWFKEQGVDPSIYKADFVPHSDTQLMATIFIVNSSGIFGEIIRGGHYQLTQGFWDGGEPITFSYDFTHWHLSTSDQEIEKYLKELISKIKVVDIRKRKLLNEKLDAKFSNYYLCGYFETVDTKEFGVWFVDYNRILGDMYSNFFIEQNQTSNDSIVKGSIGSAGNAIGKVRIIDITNINGITLSSDEILVCTMTTPDCLPLMKQAGGIVTDFGGVLSHAAIIARELKIPCITGTKTATKILKDGDVIEVDANEGSIRYVN